MKIYAITDEIKEDIVNVFIAKNDRSAEKQIENELKKSGKDLEMKVYALDIDVGFDEKFYAFYDDGDDKQARLIYSFPKDYVENKEQLRNEILNDSYSEDN